MNLHVGVIGSLAALTMAGPPSCWLDPVGSEGPAAPVRSDAGALESGCPEVPRACSFDDCPRGTLCLADGCGGSACQPAGLPCLDAADCPAGSACFDGPLGSVCLRDGPCADARDCPPGHACEAGGCVDHRVACTDDADCPEGDYCDTHAVDAAPHCQQLDRVCASDAACPVGALCLADRDDVEAERRCAFARP